MRRKDVPLSYGHNINMMIRAMRTKQPEAAFLTQILAHNRQFFVLFFVVVVVKASARLLMFTCDIHIFGSFSVVSSREMQISMIVPGRKASKWNNDLQTLLPGNKQIPLRQRKIKQPVATFRRHSIHLSSKCEPDVAEFLFWLQL